jgi:hypothetical protein
MPPGVYSVTSRCIILLKFGTEGGNSIRLSFHRKTLRSRYLVFLMPTENHLWLQNEHEFFFVCVCAWEKMDMRFLIIWRCYVHSLQVIIWFLPIGATCKTSLEKKTFYSIIMNLDTFRKNKCNKSSTVANTKFPFLFIAQKNLEAK